MTSVTRVPEPQLPGDQELSAEQARRAAVRVGLGPLLRQSAVRFRYGDGFSSSRALALQLCLAVIPLAIAVVGLSSALHAGSAGQVLRQTVLSLSPASDDDLIRLALERDLADQSGEDAGELALVLGLAAGMLALTTAMGQVERGANRIYGIRRDRPALHKYGRAFVLAVVAGIPALLGFLLLVAGAAAAEAIEQVYGLDRRVVLVLRWPVSLALSVGSITVLMRHSPRRRSPAGWSWLALGAALTLVLWTALTSGLALYLTRSGGFGSIYGPLTSVMALLLWGQLSAMALFFGFASTAQLEAARAGMSHAALDDTDPPDAGTSGTALRVLGTAYAVGSRAARWARRRAG